ncbi:hypothetical protein IFM89_029975, partial [Coptis chinensis]
RLGRGVKSYRLPRLVSGRGYKWVFCIDGGKKLLLHLLHFTGSSFTFFTASGGPSPSPEVLHLQAPLFIHRASQTHHMPSLSVVVTAASGQDAPLMSSCC